MDEKKLKQIEQELIQEIDNEQKIETHIFESSEEIAAHLVLNKRVQAEVNDRLYKFSYRLLEKQDKKILYVLIADVLKYNVAGNKYIPFSAHAEMDTRYSERDNLKAVIEGFIRHITGRQKPEVLE